MTGTDGAQPRTDSSRKEERRRGESAEHRQTDEETRNLSLALAARCPPSAELRISTISFRAPALHTHAVAHTRSPSTRRATRRPTAQGQRARERANLRLAGDITRRARKTNPATPPRGPPPTRHVRPVHRNSVQPRHASFRPRTGVQHARPLWTGVQDGRLLPYAC